MSEAARIADFGTALRKAHTRFKCEAAVIRADYAKNVNAGVAPIGLDIESMLERPTRRFLIDPMLRALDWNPDNPHNLAEESRSWDENEKRLYFDYLGLNHRGAPTLLVEAKGVDSVAPRPARAPNVSRDGMAVLLSEALGDLKAGVAPSAVLAQWMVWLGDLRTYVRSIEPANRTYLRRVVITSGAWLIVFADPVAAFVNSGAPAPSAIHCYTSTEEIVEHHADIFRLLARRRLIDTLPLTMTLGEALQFLHPHALTDAYRGVVVATRISGGVRGEYPTRTVYPALILISGGRAFAVVEYNAKPEEEPRDADGLSAFLSQIAVRGQTYEKRVLEAFGRTDLTPLPVDRYPIAIREYEIADQFASVPDSTAALAPPPPLLPQLVRQTGERNAEHEYLVITGQAGFYKAESPVGSPCDFTSVRLN